MPHIQQIENTISLASTNFPPIEHVYGMIAIRCQFPDTIKALCRLEHEVPIPQDIDHHIRSMHQGVDKYIN